MIVGLYGGVGAGKTTVAKAFLQHGAELIIADEIVKEAHRRPAIQQLVKQRFGDGAYTSGKLNAKYIADIVFEDEQSLHDLESIIHPWVEEEILRRIQHSQSKLIVLDIPLLASSPFHNLVTTRIFIDTPIEIRREVCRNSRGWSDEEHERRESKQISIDNKRKLCQYEIKNFGEHRAKIAEQVKNIIEELNKLES